MDFSSRLRAFLTNELARSGGRIEFTDTDSLFVTGRLDSIAAVRLLLFLESANGSEFPIQDLSEIDSVEKILKTIHR